MGSGIPISHGSSPRPMREGLRGFLCEKRSGSEDVPPSHSSISDGEPVLLPAVGTPQVVPRSKSKSGAGLGSLIGVALKALGDQYQGLRCSRQRLSVWSASPWP
jgi:hypothetical protein